MRNFFSALFLSTMYLCANAQVGVGTTKPSLASMLEVSSTSNNGITYGGLLPPRVPSQTERDLISATSTDTGLLIFVEETGTFEIWNGIYWETIYILSTQAVTLAVQDFDTNVNWNYSLYPSVYNIDNDVWDIVTTLGGGTTAIDNISGYFLGCRDLTNPNGGGAFVHEITFVNVDVSSIINARISFDYDVFQFDSTDDVLYEVFYDDVSQGVVTFINGITGGYSEEGTEIINIPNSVTNVRITLGIAQDGEADFAGFDNFRVYGE